jgi:antitoxin PrlF
MATEEKNVGSACPPAAECRIEAVLTVDERGQVLIPKDVRGRAGIRPGDKLTLVCWERDGAICCLTLMKAEDLSGMVRSVIGPILYPEDPHG